MRIKHILFVFSFWLLGGTNVFAEDVNFGRVNIVIGDKNLNIEYAVSYEQRARGLMFRESLCADCGMLFKFEEPRYASMWMKNTLIPLSIAFIDATGTIVNIEQMKPHDLSSISSIKPVLYALEMNPGWFEKNGVKAGDPVVITPAY